ncbi:MAG: ATP-binding protein [Eggerthellaceae bacterium]|nr:ATP-binding protein [Eggerthellaceae bacterium]
MLKRKATALFQRWLDAPGDKALLVKGARQVGKSYLVDAFARDNFEHVVKFDLVEDQATCDSLGQATSADDLFLRLSVAASSPLVAHKTVVVIDEVQRCPNILTYMKYLVQRGDYRYVLAGSLLGVQIENIDSLPVGYLTQVEMFPLDFEEFCWACGLAGSVYASAVSLFAQEEPLPDFLYDRLIGLYHRYLMVGGMPDAVNAFLASNNIDEVRTVHAGLHTLYRDDITKYAPPDLRLTIRDIYDLIPSEVGSKNRRFRLSSIADVKRFDQVQDHFLWLTQAGVALAVYNVSAPAAPLLVNVQRSMFKLFYLDAGLLLSSYPKKTYEGLLDGKASMNMGGVYEAAVAQELKAHGFALRYFTSKKVGELDFVVEDASGAVTAIEVKSGAAYRTHAALDNAMQTRGYGIDKAIVFAETNVKREGNVLYAPVFLVGALNFAEPL